MDRAGLCLCTPSLRFIKRAYILSLIAYQIFITGIPSPSFGRVEEDLYSKGIQFIETGDWEEALRFWWADGETLKRSPPDPRIGIKFIEVVTEKNAIPFVRAASDLYMWGFSSRCSPNHMEIVVQEAERLLPLLPENEDKKWKLLIENRSDSLRYLITKFWLEEDSRPTTQVNERLIEHWRRIAFARSQFTRNKLGVYDCDDRGTIYVRYGAPDRVKTGNFGSSGMGMNETMRWSDSAWLMWGSGPEYEAWAYYNIDKEYPCLFLFSRRRGMGPFVRIEGIESLIESLRHYQFSDTTYYLYQIVYYAELKEFDHFYYDRYSDLEMVWNEVKKSMRREQPWRAARVMKMILGAYRERNKLEDKVRPSDKFVSPEQSNFEEKLGKIESHIQTIRYLDDENTPGLAVLAVNAPSIRIPSIKDSVIVPEFELMSHLIVRDQQMNEQLRLADISGSSVDDISLFILDHSTEIRHYIYAADARTISGHSSNPEGTIPRILAIGKKVLNPGPPLSSGDESLEMSDLAIGLVPDSKSRLLDYRIPVLPSHRFDGISPIKIYVEGYHLFVDKKDHSIYTVEYGAVRLKGKKRKKKESIQTIYHGMSEGRRVREEMSLDISKLKPGNYEIYVKITDMISSQSKTRDVVVEVVK